MEPNGLTALIAQARRTQDWGPVLSAIPYFQFMGIGLEVVDGALVGRMRFSEHLIGNPTLPALHGGTLGALLEAVAQAELLFRADSEVLPKTITMTIDYLRSGKPRDTLARAEVLKHGRRVATVQVRAFQDDAALPIAVAMVHLLVRGEVAPGP